MILAESAPSFESGPVVVVVVVSRRRCLSSSSVGVATWMHAKELSIVGERDEREKRKLVEIRKFVHHHRREERSIILYIEKTKRDKR